MRPLLLLLLVASTALAGPVEVAIQVPVKPRIDMNRFDSVLVMGFLVGSTEIEKFDLNEETVKFLRTELKSRSSVKTLDPGEVPVLEKDDPEVFKDTTYWQHVGGIFSGALIISGIVELKHERRSGFVTEEVMSPTGVPLRVQRYKEGQFYLLSLTLYFLDGATGSVLLQEEFREEMLYDNPDQPALYGYYDLMDRIVPRFLGTIISQKYQETRYLLED
jgi:hypothetical protein